MYIVHTSIDVINEKCNVSNAASGGASNAKLDGAAPSGTAPANAQQQQGAAAGNRELYLGVLYSTEQHKVFGYVFTIQMFLSKLYTTQCARLLTLLDKWGVEALKKGQWIPSI